MPQCILKSVRTLPDGQEVIIGRFAFLLKEGDRFSIWCPRDERELVSGATQNFLDGEVAKGRLEILK
jgi:hypothetical protein